METILRKIRSLFRERGSLRHPGTLSDHLQRDIGLRDARPAARKDHIERRWRDRAGPWGLK